METNIILAGVGGQGILSISYVIDMAAATQGLQFKQAEVHGMSQRGGEVQSHLRLADHPIHSDLVPKGSATLVLSVEPLESLRYVEYLSPEGAVVSSIDPFVNIPDYPAIEQVLDAIGSLKHHTLVHAEALAREAGSAKAQNMVLLGAASRLLGIKEELLEDSMSKAFARKGEKVQKTNLEAFRAGRAADQAYQACLKAGIPARATRALVGRLAKGVLAADAVPRWKELLTGPMGSDLLAILSGKEPGKISGSPEIPQVLATQGQGSKIAEVLFKTGR
jgi:indolepyruvate ferredoxin oxidoreductase beta subunit